MAYARVLFSGFSAILIALLAPLSMFATRHQGESHAYGVGFIALKGFERFVSPWFWALAIPLFVLFFAASRLRSKLLRVLLFWTPTVLTTTAAFGVCSLVLALWLRFRNS
jgi:hypothetical protein